MVPWYCVIIKLIHNNPTTFTGFPHENILCLWSHYLRSLLSVLKWFLALDKSLWTGLHCYLLKIFYISIRALKMVSSLSLCYNFLPLNLTSLFFSIHKSNLIYTSPSHYWFLSLSSRCFCKFYCLVSRDNTPTFKTLFL